MRGEIVKATRNHAIEMAPHVRAVEAREIADSSGMKTEAALLHELSRSDSAWSWIVDGQVACMFGIVRSHNLFDLASYPWFFSTHLVETHAIPFARGCKGLLPELLVHHPRLSGMVDSRHKLSVRWLRWLGARVSEPEPWGVARVPFHHFEIGV